MNSRFNLLVWCQCVLVLAVLSRSAQVAAQAIVPEKVHGPVYLDLPDSPSLLFFKQEYQVWGEYRFIDNRKRQLDDYGDADIDAVLYQDLDLDDTRELFVMYHDATGPHVRGYGLSFDGYQYLPRLQQALDAITQRLKSFTVAGVRRELSKIPPQQFLTDYQDVNNEEINDILQGQSALEPVLVGYRTLEGISTTDISQASEYKLRYPLYIEALNGEGVSQRYQLTLSFDRSVYADTESAYSMQTDNDKPGFGLIDIGYEAVNFDWLNSGSVDIPRAGQFWGFFPQAQAGILVEEGAYLNGYKQGQWTSYQLTGQIGSRGQYERGQKVGQWDEAESLETLWRGEYQADLKQGLWVLTDMQDATVVLGHDNYLNGVLNGDSDYYIRASDMTSTIAAESVPLMSEAMDAATDNGTNVATDIANQTEMDVKSGDGAVQNAAQSDASALASPSTAKMDDLSNSLILYSKGRYLEGKKQGLWIEDDEGHGGEYRDGVKQGPWKEYDGQGQYVDGLRHGLWRHTLKGHLLESPYVNGELDGDQKEYFNATQLVRVSPYKHGELDGEERLYFPSGQLQMSMFYQQGMLYGTKRQYYENGQLKLEESWKIERFDVAMQIEETCEIHECDEYGRRLPQSWREGERRQYSATGVLMSVEPYVRNRLHGVVQRFDVNGKLESEQQYQMGNPVCRKRYLSDGRQTPETLHCQFIRF